MAPWLNFHPDQNWPGKFLSSLVSFLWQRREGQGQPAVQGEGVGHERDGAAERPQRRVDADGRPAGRVQSAADAAAPLFRLAGRERRPAGRRHPLFDQIRDRTAFQVSGAFRSGEIRFDVDARCRREDRFEQPFEFYAGDATSYGGIRVAKDGQGLTRLWQQQVQQFPMVALDTSQAIVSVYPTPNTLVQVLPPSSPRFFFSPSFTLF